MSDPGTRFADKTQEEIEKRLRSIYEKASREIIERLNAHSKRMYAKDKEMRAKRDQGEITNQQYKDWLRGQMFVEKIWQDQIQSATSVLLTANEQSNAIVEGQRRAVFTENANWQAYSIEKDSRGAISFGLYDSATVTGLIKDQPELLPPKKINGERDKAWNREKISAIMARGVITGSPLQEIAKHIGRETGNGNEKAMLRYARTAMTAAQNAGRIEVMHESQEMGIKVKKTWISTLDERTRPAHQMLDGQTEDIDQPFSSILGPIMYPGDPSADDANVWNCFVGDTKIASDSPIVRSYQHDYSGNLITVKTARGIEFTCTPNHPILTPSGWIGANRLHDGDNLVIASIGESDSLRVDPDVDHVFPCMDAFHELFKEFSGKRTTGLRVNFHGDIPASDVEIVSEERLLRKHGNPVAGQGFDKLLFKDTGSLVSAKSHFMACLGRVNVSTLGFMRGLCKPLPFLLRRMLHAVIHGFRAVAGRNSSVLQPQNDSVSRDFQFLSECLDRFPGHILTDKVISINVSSVSHIPVYNLQTDNHYYFVNPILDQSQKECNYIFVISHNCRCTLGYEYPEYQNRNVMRYDQYDREDIEDMTYQEWKESKHPDWKNRR